MKRIISMATIVSFVLSPQNLWGAKSASAAQQELEASELRCIRPLADIPQDIGMQPGPVNPALVGALQKLGISQESTAPNPIALIESLQRSLGSFPHQVSEIKKDSRDRATSSFITSDSDTDWDSADTTDSFTDAEFNESEMEDNTEDSVKLFQKAKDSLILAKDSADATRVFIGSETDQIIPNNDILDPSAQSEDPGANTPVVQKFIEKQVEITSTKTSSVPNALITPFPWFELPDEMRSVILMFLPLRDFVRITEVCKSIRQDAISAIKLHILKTIYDAKKAGLEPDILEALDEVIHYFRFDQKDSSDESSSVYWDVLKVLKENTLISEEYISKRYKFLTLNYLSLFYLTLFAKDIFNKDYFELKKAPQKLGHASFEGLGSINWPPCKMNVIPKESCCMRERYILRLQKSTLILLPDTINQLSSLTELDVSENKLLELPSQVTLMSKLKILNISRNNLTELPDGLENLHELIELNASYNKLINLPVDILGETSEVDAEFDIVVCAQRLRMLRTFNVSYNLLTALPSNIGNLNSLTDIDVSRNRLQTLPPNIGKLHQIMIFDACRNKLAHVPNEIGAMTSLIDLNLSHNSLRSLPSTMGDLQELRTLDVSNNNLFYLPTSLCKLYLLYQFNVSSNNLVYLQSKLDRIVNLKSTNLDDNLLPAQLIEKLPSVPKLTRRILTKSGKAISYMGLIFLLLIAP